MEQKKIEMLKKILNIPHVLDQDKNIADILTKETISKDINKIHNKSLSLGEKIADNFSDFAGSWKFIIGFVTIIFAWLIINSIFFKSFDPYPFILLNLVLSCVAALQAPVIMMSQNRQEKKDRMLASNEYQLNIKSELMIEELNNKINRMIENQELLQNALDDIQKKIK